jgi:predicted transcriptional regulator
MSLQMSSDVCTLGPMAKRPINLRLDEDLIKAATELASALGIDRTELISRGLRRELLYDGSREFIYVLLDAANKVRYVGRSRDPYGRLRAHLASARAGGVSSKEQWLSSMLEANQSPGMAIVDDAEPGAPIRDLEAAWIERFRESDSLTNGVAGGVAKEERHAGRTNTSIYISDDLLERIDADCKLTNRSRSNWFAVAAEAALTRGFARYETFPAPPAVVRERDAEVRARRLNAKGEPGG